MVQKRGENFTILSLWIQLNSSNIKKRGLQMVYEGYFKEYLPLSSFSKFHLTIEIQFKNLFKN